MHHFIDFVVVFVLVNKIWLEGKILLFYDHEYLFIYFLKVKQLHMLTEDDKI